MFKRFTFLFLMLVSGALLRAQERVPVFVSGQDGYRSFRIPAMIGLPDGSLLAFCEGRVAHAGDFGNIDIVMRRSADGGNTWGPLSVVVDADSLQAGNPAPVVDRTDPRYPKGRIFLFYNTGNKDEQEVRRGHGLREVWYITSSDGGNHWSQPVNITTEVHRPFQPGFNAAYAFPEGWRSYANTPGHAMQFTRGPHKGRIFVAANHSSGDPHPDATDYTAHGFYTDDHGRSFHLGESVVIAGSNESTAAELGGGRLMMNSRNQRGNVHARIVSVSYDGGGHWDTSYIDRTLPDPVNEGSLLHIGWEHNKAILAFCNAADTSRRNNLTVRISFDEGRSWTKQFLVERCSGDAARDCTAYSDLVKLDKKNIGVLYERSGYSQIVFTRVQWRP